MGPARAVRLPRTYDSDRLVADWRRLRSFGARAHMGPYHDGGWRALALRSLDGDPRRIEAGDLLRTRYRSTPVLEAADYLPEVIADIPGDKRAVRLMVLSPGARVLDHTDEDINLFTGIFRLHVPILTSPAVEFYLDGELQRWRSGELWFGDFTRPHEIHNHGTDDRVHLVIDVSRSRELEALFPVGYLASLGRIHRRRLGRRFLVGAAAQQAQRWARAFGRAARGRLRR